VPVTPPGRLYLVRHGRTAHNKLRYAGWRDVPLDDVGRRQARAVARELARRTLHVVFSSPLSRAVDTARPIADAHGVPLELRDGLKEIDYGEFQDVLKSQRKLRLRRSYRRRPMPNGESLRDVFDRVTPVREEVEAELDAGRDVAVVAHFWSLRMLDGQLDGLSFDDVLAREEYSPKNGVASTRFGRRSRRIMS
jgi:broad specificity phosphatase PhoE